MKYDVIHSKRKSVGITITGEGAVIVRAPFGISRREIARIVEEKHDWIEKHLQKLEEREKSSVRIPDPELEKLYREMVMEKCRVECQHYAELLDVTYNKITIRDQKTCWGSCSGKKNLSFNWRMILMRPMVGRYIVVHELAHLRHMNHSKEFWETVESVMPNYRKYRKWLKENGYKYIRSK